MRLLSASLLIGLLLWHVRPSRNAEPDAPRQYVVLVGAVFLLIPTQFPWYWLWCLPLMTVRPCFPLMLYVVLLPLYYIQDWGPGVYWVEHLPVWSLLAIEAIRDRQRSARVETAAGCSRRRGASSRR